jgi:hypothetical protein
MPKFADPLVVFWDWFKIFTLDIHMKHVVTFFPLLITVKLDTVFLSSTMQDNLAFEMLQNDLAWW